MLILTMKEIAFVIVLLEKESFGGGSVIGIIVETSSQMNFLLLLLSTRQMYSYFMRVIIHLFLPIFR